MGDAGVFWRNGTYNFDIASFTHKFMMDIDDGQTSVGAFTGHIAPDLLQREEGAPGWADAGVLAPYAAWQQYGDTSLLERSWPEMKPSHGFPYHPDVQNPDYVRRKKLGAKLCRLARTRPEHAEGPGSQPHTGPSVARDMKEMAAALHRDDDAAKYQDSHGSCRCRVSQARMPHVDWLRQRQHADKVGMW